MRFDKPAKTFEQQIDLLASRGLAIGNQAFARHVLENVSYYRLRAYWIPFEYTDATGNHRFHYGIKLEDIWSLYLFDRQLRLLVLDAVERIEVSLRASWAYHMANAHSPHSYLDSSLHRSVRSHSQSLGIAAKDFDRSREIFADHYKKKYHEPDLPPVWLTAEIISFGQLSTWISSLRNTRDRQAIADKFGLNESPFCSIIHHISYVRNICAHHGRLWNKSMTVISEIPKKPRELNAAIQGAHPRLLHNTLVMLDHLLSVVAPRNEWKRRLVDLITGCPQANPAMMGFPSDWQTRAAWRVA